jgi:uncharacterized membrane protein
MIRNSKTLYLTQMGMLIAIIIVLTVTNIGNIPIGPIVATTYHIPVIIGAVLLGPKAGALLGGLWGVLGFYLVLTGQTTSIVAMTVVQHSVWVYFVISVIPRILTGFLSGYVFIFSQRFLGKNSVFCFGLTGAVGALCNTAFYLGFLYILAKPLVAEALKINLDAVVSFIIGVVCVNGAAEAILAAMIVMAVCKSMRYFK